MFYRRLPRFDLPGRTYFITSCAQGRRRFLARADLTELVINLYANIRDRGDIALHGYVVMPDHYHVVFTLKEADSVSMAVRKVHGPFARHYRGVVGPLHRIWQRRFRDHVVRDDDDWHTKMEYIHTNPVRAGLVGEATEYEWSSCRFWLTGDGPVKCDPAW